MQIAAQPTAFFLPRADQPLPGVQQISGEGLRMNGGAGLLRDVAEHRAVPRVERLLAASRLPDQHADGHALVAQRPSLGSRVPAAAVLRGRQHRAVARPLDRDVGEPQ